jgi:hypothetical protein
VPQGTASSFLTHAKGTYHRDSSVGRDKTQGMAATLVIK